MAKAAPADVYVPPVLTPKSGDVWQVGDQVTVTWDVSNLPTQITNRVAFLLLRKANMWTPGELRKDMIQLSCV